MVVGDVGHEGGMRGHMGVTTIERETETNEHKKTRDPIPMHAKFVSCSLAGTEVGQSSWDIKRLFNSSRIRCTTELPHQIPKNTIPAGRGHA